jgi:hypothetical protein
MECRRAAVISFIACGLSTASPDNAPAQVRCTIAAWKPLPVMKLSAQPKVPGSLNGCTVPPFGTRETGLSKPNHPHRLGRRPVLDWLAEHPALAERAAANRANDPGALALH